MQTFKQLAAISLSPMFAMTPAMKMDLSLPPHLYLDAVQRGYWREPWAGILAWHVNLGAQLSKAFTQDAQLVMRSGLDATRSLLQRANVHVPWQTDEAEVAAIGLALVYADELLEVCTRREITLAIKAVMRSMG